MGLCKKQHQMLLYNQGTMSGLLTLPTAPTTDPAAVRRGNSIASSAPQKGRLQNRATCIHPSMYHTLPSLSTPLTQRQLDFLVSRDGNTQSRNTGSLTWLPCQSVSFDLYGVTAALCPHLTEECWRPEANVWHDVVLVSPCEVWHCPAHHSSAQS